MPFLSGAITVAEGLDRETVDVYNLVITAKDGGNRVRAVISLPTCTKQKALSTTNVLCALNF